MRPTRSAVRLPQPQTTTMPTDIDNALQMRQIGLRIVR